MKQQSRVEGRCLNWAQNNENLAVIPEGGSDKLSKLVGDTAISGKRYLGYLEFGPEVWTKMFRLFANADDHPMLIHCTAGKDRTGVFHGLSFVCLGSRKGYY